VIGTFKLMTVRWLLAMNTPYHQRLDLRISSDISLCKHLQSFDKLCKGLAWVPNNCQINP
jgi:hypothetical protein